MGIIVSLIVISLAVVLHEMGHYFAAKVVGVEVKEFALGIGPKIFSKKGKETLFSIRPVLLGGFCSMARKDGNEVYERTFESKSVLARLFIIVAGPIMNLLFALILISIVSVYFKGYSMFGSVVEGVRFVSEVFLGTFSALWNIVTFGSNLGGLVGPVGVIDISNNVYSGSISRGLIESFKVMSVFTAVISASMGALNLFPFPVLDGGKIVLLFIEGILGRPIEGIEKVVNIIGVVLLLALFIFLIFKDIVNILF